LVDELLEALARLAKGLKVLDQAVAGSEARRIEALGQRSTKGIDEHARQTKRKVKATQPALCRSWVRRRQQGLEIG